MSRIVLVDDDVGIRATLELHLKGRGFDVGVAHSAATGYAAIADGGADAVICDIRMEGRDGLSLLGDITATWPKLPVIMITAFHDLESTVASMRGGAVDYIPKPIDLDQLDNAIERALLRRNIELKGALEIDDAPDSRLIIGHSRAMNEVFKTIGLVADSRVTVLITGESGTGKELVARAVHNVSRYRDHPFLAINCAALVDDLLENELFGHEKGAYTGANEAQKGKAELVGEGTLFLDEVGELSPRVQGKLLRLLEQREFIPVGGSKPRSSRCRFIAATNVDLEERVRDGRFRGDLYHRLHVVSIKTPALRERKEDIPLLVQYLMKRINLSLEKRIRFVTAAVLNKLVAHSWPGNVRELENVLIRAVVFGGSDTIAHVALPAETENGVDLTYDAVPDEDQLGDGLNSLKELEREHIEKVLEMTSWHKGRACEILGISRPRLERRIREFGLGAGRS